LGQGNNRSLRVERRESAKTRDVGARRDNQELLVSEDQVSGGLVFLEPSGREDLGEKSIPSSKWGGQEEDTAGEQMNGRRIKIVLSGPFAVRSKAIRDFLGGIGLRKYLEREGKEVHGIALGESHNVRK